MHNIPTQRPGDRVFRRRRASTRLRRVLKVPELFAAGYGNVGSSIYYALGVVALVAVGATPVALYIAGLFFICTALTYAEGTAMFPEAGGSASFARHGFNELVSFVAGWGLMLSYVVTISISAYTISPYLGYFWEPLKESPVIGTFFSVAIVAILMLINILGAKESGLVNIIATAIDLITQLTLIILGFLLIFSMPVLLENMFGNNNWPGIGKLIFGVALASLAYTGVETISQMAEETLLPHTRIPRALVYMMVAVVAIFSCISVIALCAMTPQSLATEWARDPVAGIANSLPFEWLRTMFEPLVGVLAATILLIATNAGLMGISRLSFSMGANKQLPSLFTRIHSRFRTPYISLVIFTVVAIIILIPGMFAPGFFLDLGALYTFGSLLSFLLAHAAILSLRYRQPNTPRPFKIGLNIRFRGREFPLTSLIGVTATAAIWVVVLIQQPYARNVGFAWMAIGIIGYVLYRKSLYLPLRGTKQ